MIMLAKANGGFLLARNGLAVVMRSTYGWESEAGSLSVGVGRMLLIESNPPWIGLGIFKWWSVCPLAPANEL